MSQPRIDEFTVRLTFDDDGAPVTATYYDKACGKAGQRCRIEDPILLLSNQHLGHCQVSHKIFPPMRCPAVYTLDDGQQIRCELDQNEHGDERHRFTW